jgi:hypothetical protein
MAKYEEPDINPFDAPIPGQSLTDKPGNYPWEHPPKYTDFMEASTFIWNRIHLKRNNKRLLALMNSGVPIESLAILLAPTVAKMYVSLAQAAGLEDITLDLPRKKMKSVVGEIMALKQTARPTTAKARKEKFEEEVTKGLMSRTSEEE